jgi:peptide chain release factor subunit 1
MTRLPQPLEHAVAGSADNILTVYLKTNQADASNLNRAFETHLASRLKDLAQSVENEAQRADFAAACARVQELVAEHKPGERSLVIFATSDRILLSRGLRVDLETEVHWGRPYIKPYLEALDEFERYIVVVTDKWHARILSVFLGTVEASVEVADNPRTTHIRSAGMDHLESQSQFQRRADENTKKHIKHVLRELETLIKSRPSNRLIVGGNVEAVAEFLSLLPKHLRAKIVGTAPLSMSDTTEHQVKTALQMDLKAERDTELNEVKRLQEAAGKKNKAVNGIDDTLRALQEERILSFYYAEGFTASGQECNSCTRLFTTNAEDKCGYCGNSLKNTEDLLDAILLKALKSGARIELVRGEAAQRLRETGGIGAFLRY